MKKERPPFQADSPPPDEVKSIIPSDLVCALCTDLMSDAVLIPCCGESFCDDCESNHPKNDSTFFKFCKFFLKVLEIMNLVCVCSCRYTCSFARF